MHYVQLRVGSHAAAMRNFVVVIKAGAVWLELACQKYAVRVPQRASSDRRQPARGHCRRSRPVRRALTASPRRQHSRRRAQKQAAARLSASAAGQGDWRQTAAAEAAVAMQLILAGSGAEEPASCSLFLPQNSRHPVSSLAVSVNTASPR